MIDRMSRWLRSMRRPQLDYPRYCFIPRQDPTMVPIERQAPPIVMELRNLRIYRGHDTLNGWVRPILRGQYRHDDWPAGQWQEAFWMGGARSLESIAEEFALPMDWLLDQWEHAPVYKHPAPCCNTQYKAWSEWLATYGKM